MAFRPCRWLQPLCLSAHAFLGLPFSSHPASQTPVSTPFSGFLEWALLVTFLHVSQKKFVWTSLPGHSIWWTEAVSRSNVGRIFSPVSPWPASGPCAGRTSFLLHCARKCMSLYGKCIRKYNCLSKHIYSWDFGGGLWQVALQTGYSNLYSYQKGMSDSHFAQLSQHSVSSDIWIFASQVRHWYLTGSLLNQKQRVVWFCLDLPSSWKLKRKWLSGGHSHRASIRKAGPREATLARHAEGRAVMGQAQQASFLRTGADLAVQSGIRAQMHEREWLVRKESRCCPSWVDVCISHSSVILHTESSFLGKPKKRVHQIR